MDPTKPFSVTPDNRSLTVIVDNIASQLQLDLVTFHRNVPKMVESKVNLMADKLGRQVSGVKVEFDTESMRSIYRCYGDGYLFLQVAGSADFGLEDVQAAFGTTSTFIVLTPDTKVHQRHCLFSKTEMASGRRLPIRATLTITIFQTGVPYFG